MDLLLALPEVESPGITEWFVATAGCLQTGDCESVWHDIHNI
jgi:hypothetical protein